MLYDIKKRRANSNYVTESSNRGKAVRNIINEVVKPIQSKQHRCQSGRNNYFTGIGRRKCESISTTDSNVLQLIKNMNSPSGSMFFENTSQEDIAKIIFHMKTGNAKDVHDFNIKILKFVIHEIKEPFAVVINKCISDGVFPTELKLAKVILLSKGGSLIQSQC